jgi:hypothetical protein
VSGSLTGLPGTSSTVAGTSEAAARAAAGTTPANVSESSE